MKLERTRTWMRFVSYMRRWLTLRKIPLSRTRSHSGTPDTARPWVDELHQWVTTVDHQTAVNLYILSALLFLAIRGVRGPHHSHFS